MSRCIFLPANLSLIPQSRFSRTAGWYPLHRLCSCRLQLLSLHAKGGLVSASPSCPFTAYLISLNFTALKVAESQGWANTELHELQHRAGHCHFVIDHRILLSMSYARPPPNTHTASSISQLDQFQILNTCKNCPFPCQIHAGSLHFRQEFAVVDPRIRAQCLGAPSPGPQDMLTFRARVAAVASRDHPPDSGRGVPAPPGLRPSRVSWCGCRANPAARWLLVPLAERAHLPARSAPGLKTGAGRGGDWGNCAPGGGGGQGTEETEGGDQKGSRKRAGSGRTVGRSVCLEWKRDKRNQEGHWRSGKLRAGQAPYRASELTGGGGASRGTIVPTAEQLLGPLPRGSDPKACSPTPHPSFSFSTARGHGCGAQSPRHTEGLDSPTSG